MISQVKTDARNEGRNIMETLDKDVTKPQARVNRKGRTIPHYIICARHAVRSTLYFATGQGTRVSTDKNDAHRFTDADDATRVATSIRKQAGGEYFVRVAVDSGAEVAA